MLQKLKLLKDFDVLLYATDGSYFLSSAKQTICFAMVPNRRLYHMTPLNRIKTRGWKWIANSRFTQMNLKRFGVTSHIVYPIIELPTDCLPISKPVVGTSLTLISVGRFFRHLHSKRHDVAIAWFVQFVETYPQYAGSKLILVGGLKQEDKKYYDSLKKLALEHPHIVFKPNISYEELHHIYRSGDFYLHFAGWGINEMSHPERTEHLGITPLEAMSYGCIPLCYASGGIPEIVKDGVTGNTFTSREELSQKLVRLGRDTALQEKMRGEGLKLLNKEFSRAAFINSLDTL
ncbi:MAG: glycosyltransferase [Candidatus Roizmanbacteria bacterium]